MSHGRARFEERQGSGGGGNADKNACLTGPHKIAKNKKNTNKHSSHISTTGGGGGGVDSAVVLYCCT